MTQVDSQQPHYCRKTNTGLLMIDVPAGDGAFQSHYAGQVIRQFVPKKSLGDREIKLKSIKGRRLIYEVNRFKTPAEFQQ